MGDAVDRHVDRAGQHHEAQLAVAGGKAFGFTGGQAHGAKAHMRPAGARGRDFDNLAALGGSLGKQRADHHATFAFRRPTITRSVSWPFFAYW